VSVLSLAVIAASQPAADAFHPGPSKSLTEQQGLYYLPISNGETKTWTSLATFSELTEEVAGGWE
jgi:hypothetical protein